MYLIYTNFIFCLYESGLCLCADLCREEIMFWLVRQGVIANLSVKCDQGDRHKYKI